DALFASDCDPWRFRTRWYEQRKRALTLACLPQTRYGSGFEPGCANGELSAALAERCDRLHVSDASARAVALARSRLQRHAHVVVQQATMPDGWPAPAKDSGAEAFDLIVVSELGYFLRDAAEITRLGRRARAALTEGGTLLACHWRHPINGYALDGDTVHQLLAQAHGLHRLGGYLDADLRLDVWQTDQVSVAAREGLV
ncbi:MAG: SAM-dependent methyltransferase, partial [Rubrivivax sp.]